MNSNKIKYNIEYLLLRTLQEFLSLIPRTAALKIGEISGLLLYYSGVCRKIALKNMEHVGLWDSSQLKKILRDLYLNIGRYASDFLRKPVNFPYTIRDYHYVDSAMAQGKGLKFFWHTMGTGSFWRRFLEGW